MRICSVLIAGMLLLSQEAFCQSAFSLKLSGPGAVNDSTIKAGESFFLDIYATTDKHRKGVSVGFSITSPDNITNIWPVADSGKGVSPDGSVKGHSGWENFDVWDLTGLRFVPVNWDGSLPELIGFGGVAIKNGFHKSEPDKKISIELVVEETGTLVVDSAFFPPTGRWLLVPPTDRPDWGGPYRFKVVK